MERQQAAAEKERARQAPLMPGGKGGGGRGRGRGTQNGEPGEGRFKRWGRFLREVRSELKKVAWPSRTEIVTYSVVVLVSVTFITLFVFVLDLGLGKAMFHLFGGGSPSSR
jgi:preprotein translocase subunit SecE